MSELVLEDDRAFAFLSALQEELSFYTEVLKLSQEQSILLHSGEEDKLLKVMEEKQTWIARLEESQQSFKEERGKLQSTNMGEFSSIDDQLDLVLVETEKVLKELVENESRDMEVLQAFQKEYQEKMQQLGKGKSLANAYLKPKKKSSLNRSV